MRKLFIVALMCVPLPGCNGEDIQSAGSKAQVGCQKAIKVCEAAGGILGWELRPVDWSIEGMTKP